MAHSRIPGPLGMGGYSDDDDFWWSPHGIFPAETPGPHGLYDQGDPDAFACLGDTPGPLGVNDHADPDLRGAIKVPVGWEACLCNTAEIWFQDFDTRYREALARYQKSNVVGGASKVAQLSSGNYSDVQKCDVSTSNSPSSPQLSIQPEDLHKPTVSLLSALDLGAGLSGYGDEPSLWDMLSTFWPRGMELQFFPVGVAGAVFAGHHGVSVSFSLGISTDRTVAGTNLILVAQFAGMHGKGLYIGGGYSPGFVVMKKCPHPLLGYSLTDHLELNAGWGPSAGLALDGLFSGDGSLTVAGSSPRWPSVGVGGMFGIGGSASVVVVYPITELWRNLIENENYIP